MAAHHRSIISLWNSHRHRSAGRTPPGILPFLAQSRNRVAEISVAVASSISVIIISVLPGNNLACVGCLTGSSTWRSGLGWNRPDFRFLFLVLSCILFLYFVLHFPFIAFIYFLQQNSFIGRQKRDSECDKSRKKRGFSSAALRPFRAHLFI